VKPKTIALCALVLAYSLQAAPQGANKQKQVAKPNVKQGLPPASQPIARPKTPAQIPDAQVNRLMKMSPEEREKVLSNLPPQRRQALEQRLSRFDQLPTEQKAELDRRFQEFQKLSPVRRQAVRDELQTLRGLRQPERRARMNSPEFREQYSPEEIRLMRDVYGLP
jgi:hypothetical protein